jgi:cell wall-associated NlpC family hydrolase
VRNNLSFINVYKKKTKSEIVTQLLYGETFKKVSSNKSWLKIRNDLDNYQGYIKNKNYPNKVKNTHKIFNIYAQLYSKPNLKNKINKKLSFGSRIKVTKKKNNFYKFDNMWVKGNDLKKIGYKTKNYFNYAYQFLDVKYKWGGKHFTGVDCSGLVQLCLNFNNKFCPRDAKDQIKYFKKKVKFAYIKKNDLIFWKGHVAVIISKNNLIHAYGPFKKTVKMPINETINRIYKTANLKVIGIRRII